MIHEHLLSRYKAHPSLYCVVWLMCVLGLAGCGKELQPALEGDTPEIIQLKKMGAKVDHASFDTSPEAPRNIDLRKTGFTDSDLKLLEKIKIQTLNLEGTNITDAGLDTLAAHQNLQGALNLVGTKITNSGLVKVKEMKKINNLALGRTAVTDEGLQHLEGLSNLEILDLHLTEVTDAGLEYLKKSKSLAILSLGGSKVTPEGARETKTLFRL